MLLTSASFAQQGVIEDGDCPNQKEGKSADGNGGGNKPFTYESRATAVQRSDGPAQKFERCLKNKSTEKKKENEVWTHWTYVLPASWIPANQRLYGYSVIPGAEPFRQTVDLWFGDDKRGKLAASTTCFKTKDGSSCRFDKASVPLDAGFRRVQLTGSPSGQAVVPRPVPIRSDVAARWERTNPLPLVVYAYQEFFWPLEPGYKVSADKPPAKSIKMRLSMTSTLEKSAKCPAGCLSYILHAAASSRSEASALLGEMARIRGVVRFPKGAVHAQKPFEFVIEPAMLLETTRRERALPVAASIPTIEKLAPQRLALDVVLVDLRAEQRSGAEDRPLTVVPLDVVTAEGGKPM